MLSEPASCEALQFARDFIADGLSPSVAVMQANDPHEMLFPAGVIAMILGWIIEFADVSQACRQPRWRRCRRARQASAIDGLANVIWPGGQNQSRRWSGTNTSPRPTPNASLARRERSSLPWKGLQEEWVGSLPTLDLQSSLMRSTLVPGANPQAGPEWESNVQ